MSPFNSALENCSSSKRIETRTNLGGKGNHSKRLFRRHSYLLAKFINFFKKIQPDIERFLISTFMVISRICIQNKQLQPKIMKHTSKQLKRI